MARLGSCHDVRAPWLEDVTFIPAALACQQAGAWQARCTIQGSSIGVFIIYPRLMTLQDVMAILPLMLRHGLVPDAVYAGSKSCAALRRSVPVML